METHVQTTYNFIKSVLSGVFGMFQYSQYGTWGFLFLIIALLIFRIIKKNYGSI